MDFPIDSQNPELHRLIRLKSSPRRTAVLVLREKDPRLSTLVPGSDLVTKFGDEMPG